MATDFGDLNFDSIERVQVEVTIGDDRYVLKEATGDAACRYRNSILRATKLGPEGKPSSIDGIVDSEPLLVSLCLFTAEDNKPVPLSTVRSWPNRIVKKLYETAEHISELKETEAGESAKNEQETTKDG